MTTEILNWNALPPRSCREAALTIGNFDGVHRGHLALLAELRDRARELHAAAIALTFDPHPLKLLRPEQFKPLLTTAQDRAALLQAHGADHVIVLRTVPELLRLTAEEFFRSMIQDRLAARLLVEGPNFGFGRGRQGNVQMLETLCGRAGIGFVVVPPLEIDGKVVASSRVRTALVQGLVAEAAHLLGRPYRLRGVVGTGQRRGQTLGFPTANLERIPTIVPAEGVYAVRVRHGDECWPGAANIGPNPTFGESSRKIEVHLIGFHGDLVGQELAVDFMERLRDTRPFPDAQALVDQLQRDVARARQIVG